MIIRKIIKEFKPELFWKLLKTAKKSKKLINTKIIKLIDIILFIPQNFVIFLINSPVLIFFSFVYMGNINILLNLLFT